MCILIPKPVLELFDARHVVSAALRPQAKTSGQAGGSFNARRADQQMPRRVPVCKNNCGLNPRAGALHGREPPPCSRGESSMWETAKKTWCCATVGLACDPAAAQAAPVGGAERAVLRDCVRRAGVCARRGALRSRRFELQCARVVRPDTAS